MRHSKTTLLAALGSTMLLASTAGVAEDTAKPKISYSYIEGAYVHNNFNPNGLVISDRDGVGDTTDDNFGTLSSATGNGGAARVSVNLPFGSDKLGFHFVSDYLQTSHVVGISVINLMGQTAAGTLDTKQKELRAALGLHAMVSENVSLFAELGVNNSKISYTEATLALGSGGSATADLGSASGSRTALDAKLGLRAMVSEHVELTGYARYNGNGKIVSDGNSGTSFSSKFQAGAGGFYHFNSRIAVGADYEFAKPGRLRLVARVSF